MQNRNITRREMVKGLGLGSAALTLQACIDPGALPATQALAAENEVQSQQEMQQASKRLIIEKEVEMPMRDGVVLRGDIYRPDTDEPVPAIIKRTPYDKDLGLLKTWNLDPMRFAKAGYAVIYQDTRGRYTSDGDFYPYRYEVEDGYDTVEWVADQPWCSGAIGMAGLSYMGAAQWMAAIAQPPHLKAMVPITIGSQHYMDMMSYKGGAFKAGYLIWWASLFVAPDTLTKKIAAGEATLDDLLQDLAATDDIESQVNYLPMADLPLLQNKDAAPYYFDWLQRETYDTQPTTIRDHYDKIQVPAWNVSGWYDYFLDGTLENFTRMQKEGGSEVARTEQRLLIGPWDHTLGSAGAGFDFGIFASKAGVDFDGQIERYFDYYLKDEENGLPDDAPIRLYVMGEDVWRDEQEWPLARTDYTEWYLHSDGDAVANNGSLSPETPADGEATDAYVYDPRHPAPTLGGAVGLPGLLIGANVGYQDQRPLEARSDVLVYTSTPLTEAVEVTGPLTVTLYAASSAPDTDFMVRLCDVHPDGSSRILADGVIRARYRDGYENPTLIEPDEVVEYTIDLVATSNLFKVGHAIRVHITSSSFPFINPNANSGKPIWEDTDDDLTPALQTIFHDVERPSHIVLPIIPWQTS